MLIPEKKLLRNYTLRPSYPQNIAELDKQEAYKQWFIYAMISINKQVELLHKQLIRKRKAKIADAYHPLYKNAYIVHSYNIKSSSTLPYNRYDDYNLGLNQFFVGQNPYKHYRGDPSSKDGIYHDICEIRVKWNIISKNYTNFPKDVILLFEKKDALKYADKGWYYVDEELSSNLLPLLQKAIKSGIRVSYTFKATALVKMIKKNNEWVYPSINDIKIPKARFINNVFDIDTYLQELRELNEDIIVVVRNIAYLDYIQKPDLLPEYFKVSNDFLETFNSLKKRYKVNFASPLCFWKSFNYVYYKEPYAIFPKNILNKGKEIQLGFYPLYNKNSNLPFGRRDRWVALWDSFYELYVYENDDLAFLKPIITIVLAVATWYIGGQGAWLSGFLGEGLAAAVSLTVSVGLAYGASTGNKTFMVLNALWGLAGFIGNLGANNWNLAANFAKNAPAAAQEMTAFEATLNIIGNLTTGATLTYNVVKSITEKSPNMLNASDDNTEKDLSGNGSEALELAKDIINPTIWYDFETADILNENTKKLNNTIFVF